MRMLPDKSTHIYCLNGTITKVQFNLLWRHIFCRNNKHSYLLILTYLACKDKFLF